MIKFLLILLILIEKLIKLNLLVLKREISGYPKIVKKFENNFSKYIGKTYGITFCNGTSSIEAALYALDLSPGDEILVTSSTFHASLGPVRNLGYNLIFVDIDEVTFTIDCSDLKKKINEKSKALLIVHPWGYPCNMEKVTGIVKTNNLYLVEDCSHAHGAIYDKKKVGSFSDISCFSLQGNKAIGAGEGGIALTDNETYYLRMSKYGHLNRHEKEFEKNLDFTDFKKTGLSKKLRAHPLGISMAYVDFKYLDLINKYKIKIYNKIDLILKNYKSIKLMEVNKKAERGGFFGGYPFFFTDKKNISEIKKVFNKYKINLIKYPWYLHHQMDIFGKTKTKLTTTEKMSDQFYMIHIPYFLNFNFRKLKKCLSECRNNKLVE
tara:strand:+ start:1924 stop:3060 length:1137 start_codon:yes stop_codon:yes gene_type:complete